MAVCAFVYTISVVCNPGPWHILQEGNRLAGFYRLIDRFSVSLCSGQVRRAESGAILVVICVGGVGRRYPDSGNNFLWQPFYETIFPGEVKRSLLENC